MKKLLAVSLVLALVLSGCSRASSSRAASETSGTVYTGTAAGHNGDVSVNVTFDADGKITAVELGEHSETPEIYEYAREKVPAEIVEYQSTEVDGAAGATFTSIAIRNAVKDAIEQAGYDTADYARVPEKSSEEKEITTQVLVIGGGGSGLAAAAEASKRGAETLVIETNSFTGGDTLLSGGMMLTGATEDEKSEYNSLTADELCRALENWSGDYFNRDMTLSYLEHTKENYEWIMSNYTGSETIVMTHDAGWTPFERDETADDIDFTLAIAESETEQATWADVQGMWITDTLRDIAEANGTQIMTETTATELIIEDGAVKGAAAEGMDGTVYRIYADKVIIATGGYGANAELKKAWTETDGTFYGFSSMQGFGVTAGEQAGAKLEFNTLADTGGEYGSDIYSTIGGLVINENCEVLDENDEPIANLYAAGEITCVQSLDPWHFSSGENNGWAVYTGRIAGTNAAAAVAE